MAKPLAVRVAEALACRPTYLSDKDDWWCSCRNNDHGDGSGFIRAYDTDWSATGPLIVEEEISLDAEMAPREWVAGKDVHAPTGLPHDEPYGGSWQTREARGETPLVAVCNLLLKLHQEGLLP